MPYKVRSGQLKGVVARILPFSSVDGPGNRSVVFLQGCNYDCLYCHNPETIPVMKPEGDTGHADVMTVEEILSDLRKVKVFTAGVTISGGECTVQFEFLMALLAALKKEAFNVYLDTNGGFSSDKLERLMVYADGFMLDLKSADEAEHEALTGVSNKDAVRTLHAVAAAGKLYELRTVVVPGLLDNERTVSSGAEIIAKYDPQIRYKLIKYRQHGVRKKLLESPSPTDEMMEALAEMAREKGCRNVLIV